jgi:predicted ATP-binding protein involved in virulence
LEHYRCFKNLDIDFDDQLTVLVGVNGAGKTATLDALSFFLRYVGHPDNRNSRNYSMPLEDVAIGYKPNDIIYNLKVKSNSGGKEEITTLSFEFINTSQNRMNFIMHNAFGSANKAPVAMPQVFVAYMAGRFISEADSFVPQTGFQIPPNHQAFENNFNRTIDYASTLSWFYNADGDEARAMRDEGLREELPELKAIREALSKALLGQYEKPRMYGNPSELIIYKKDTDIAYKVSQLSDGYRAMLALVLDLARRMAQACGENARTDESILHTPAIVLIDEVELHLHPAWQQTVLNTLMDIFPNTQFIVTTHSPQVLTSVANKHIRVLNDGRAYTVDAQTQGVEASMLLKRVFGVEPRPKGLEIVQTLKEYSNLVYEDEWDTPKAEELRKKLDAHYGNDELELSELDLHIENRKWESGL